MRVVLDIKVTFKDDLTRICSTFVYHRFLIERKSSLKQNLSMVEPTCCLMNTATGRVNDGFGNTRVTIPFIKVPNVVHWSEHFGVPSIADPRLNSLIMIICMKLVYV